MKIKVAAEPDAAPANHLINACGYLQTLSRNTADGDLTKVLDAVVGLPVDCLKAHSAILLHLSPDGGPCVPLASKNASWGLPADCHAHHGCSVRDVADAQSPKVVSRLCSPISACADLLHTSGSHTLACIPIVTDGHCPVVLVCSRVDTDPFLVWELEILNTAANHAAAALMSSNRDTEHRRRADSLERIRTIASSSIDDSLELAFLELLRFVGADGGSVLVREDSSLRIGAAVGLEKKALPQRLLLESGSVSGQALSSHQPVLIQGSANRTDYPNAIPRPEVVSSMILPLISNKAVLGVLNLNRTSSTKQQFTDDELALATTAAHYLAMALHNARLHHAVRTQIKTFGSLHRVAKSVTSRLEPDLIAKLIVKSLKSLVGCETCAVFLKDSRSREYNVAGGFGMAGGDAAYRALLPESIVSTLEPGNALLVDESYSSENICMTDMAVRAGLRSALFAPLSLKNNNSGVIALFRSRPGGFSRQEISLVQGLSELASIAFENARLYERQKAIANVTQRELTPCVAGNIPGFQIGTRFTPAHNVGGDYFDLIRVDESRYGLAILDVSGKDTAASQSVGMCKYALRALAEHIPSPARLMAKMNRFICEYIEEDSFISMCYVLIDSSHDEIVYASAGHEPGILHKAGAGNQRHLHSSGMLLGVHPEARFTERRARLSAGDVLLLYTDGLINALYMKPFDPMVTLGRMLSENALHHPQKITDNIHEAAMREGSQRSPDDIAMVALRRTKRIPVHGK